jgi:long-chain acyl-CoA synthetase
MSYLDKPWLKSYKLGPYKLKESLAPFPIEPVFKALDQASEKYPGQTAILFLGRTTKYSQLKNLVDKFSTALVGMGVKKGDRVCIFLPNCPEFIISNWAILKAGGVVVPTSILRTDEGLIHELAGSASKIIICRQENLERVLAIRNKCEIEHVIVTSTQGYDIQEIGLSLPKNIYEFRKCIYESDPHPIQVDIDPLEDLCEVAFTGGATGVPKGVMITHFNRYSCILQGFPWLMKPILPGFVGKASVLVPIPLFHSYGIYTHQISAYLGLRVILMPDPRDTDLFAEYIQKYRPFMVPAVPTQFMRLSEMDLSKMNVLPMSASAPLPKEVSSAIKAKLGMPVSEAYGLTETSPATHYNLSAFSRITGFAAKEKIGIGIPTPDLECMLLDDETGDEVPYGQPGELVLRGPQVMKGYWPEPGSGLTEDGWLHTGDIAVMDEDGYFQIVDRTKDMVNVSGMKVYTNVVDEVLFRHPGVLMAAAFGVPDPKLPGSERVMAVIQLRTGFEHKVSGKQIIDHCREHLPPYAVPKYVEFRPELPLTVSEKVFKKTLREEAINKMKTETIEDETDMEKGR